MFDYSPGPIWLTNQTGRSSIPKRLDFIGIVSGTRSLASWVHFSDEILKLRKKSTLESGRVSQGRRRWRRGREAAPCSVVCVVSVPWPMACSRFHSVASMNGNDSVQFHRQLPWNWIQWLRIRIDASSASAGVDPSSIIGPNLTRARRHWSAMDGCHLADAPQPPIRPETKEKKLNQRLPPVVHEPGTGAGTRWIRTMDYGLFGLINFDWIGVDLIIWRVSIRALELEAWIASAISALSLEIIGNNIHSWLVIAWSCRQSNTSLAAISINYANNLVSPTGGKCAHNLIDQQHWWFPD